jgi:hypothetical protein
VAPTLTTESSSGSSSRPHRGHLASVRRSRRSRSNIASSAHLAEHKLRVMAQRIRGFSDQAVLRGQPRFFGVSSLSTIWARMSMDSARYVAFSSGFLGEVGTPPP